MRVCVFGLGFRLRPATPGWGIGVCVCACVRAPLIPRHFWLRCAAWVCVLWLGFRLRPATPGWGVGVFVCLCARSACTPPLLAGVCGVVVCAWARVSAAPRHSWLGCWGVCVFVCALRLYPATPGRGVRRGCVCFGLGLGCALPLLAGVLGCVCARAPTPLVPRHSWLGCAAWVCVLWLGFRLRPASPGWGVGVCVCLCARSACTPPLLAGVCGVGVCAWAWVSAAPRLSWVGCWGVCVLVCPLRLYPATPGWGVWCGCVCLGSGFGCAPPLLAGVLGCVCVLVRPPLVPRHSWLGCAAWVCVLGLGSRLRPATRGWGVRVCVCLCARSACSPPLLAKVCGVCLFGLGFRLRPATPGRGVGVCVCLCARSACTPPLLAGVFALGVCALAWVSAAPRHSWLGCWGVCVLVRPLRLHPATPGWGVWCGCVCLGSGFRCNPPLLAGVLGCVCVRVCAPLVPRHSWLGCAAWVCVWALVSAAPRHSWLGCSGVCVFVCPLRLYPATPGWGVWCGCVCFGSGFGCAPRLLAGVLGCVCVCVRAPLVPRHSWLGSAACLCGLGVAWHLFLCRGSLCVVRAARVCGTRWLLSLGTCPCAVVLAGGVPLWRALWPRVGASCLVQSGRSRCSGRLSRRRGAFPHPGGLRPRIYWAAARGTWRPAENRALCACRWPLPAGQRLSARSTWYPFGAPRWGCPWRVPPASVLGCVRCGGWRVWTRSLTRPVSRTARLSLFRLPRGSTLHSLRERVEFLKLACLIGAFVDSVL